MVQVTRFLTALSFLLAASSTANALATRQDGAMCSGSEFCLKHEDVHVALAPSVHGPTKRVTNAERLARGLPPLKPTRLYARARVARAGPSGVPTTNYRGIIQVLSIADNSLLGYISQNSLNTAQLRYDPATANALIVDFSAPTAATTTTQIEISTENQDTGFSLLSLIQGRDDIDSSIGVASYQYGYIGGSAHTNEGATPQTVANSYTQATGLSRTAESSVWTFNSVSNTLSPEWINPDGTFPITLNFAQSTALYFGGDPVAFNSRYPAPVTDVYYVFAPL